jgi:protease II
MRGTIAHAALQAGSLPVRAASKLPGARLRRIALHGPFIDVSTTLQDEIIPLTASGWSQRGDPQRARKTDATPLLFHLGMAAGHSGRGGRSGRFAQRQDAARKQARFIELAGIPERARARACGPAGRPAQRPRRKASASVMTAIA